MKTVLANGVFDFHFGHLIHLEQARGMGDRLIVSVTSDAAVNKGLGRPVFRDWQRFTMLRALRCVDNAVIVGSALEALELVHPSIFVKGPDYDIDRIEPAHREFCKRNGIEIRFTTGEKFSSTALFK